MRPSAADAAAVDTPWPRGTCGGRWEKGLPGWAGPQVQPNILFSLETPRGAVSLAAIMVLIHVTGSYQVYSMPIYGALLSEVVFLAVVYVSF